MRRGFPEIVLLACLVSAALISDAVATDVNLAVLGGGSIPIGDFGRKTNVIEIAPHDSYRASGGAGKGGFVIDVEAEAEVKSRIFAGARFGYMWNPADASEIQGSGLLPEGLKLDVSWTVIFAAAFTRLVVYDSPAFDLYARAGVGLAAVKNNFEATLEEPFFLRGRLESSFDLGSHFLLNAGAGGEYKIKPNISLVAEVGLIDVFTDGARATAEFSGFSLNGTQAFDIQSLEIVAGLRLAMGS